MNRGVLLACCGILFLLSAAITSRLANDDGPFEPRQVPQPIIADLPTNALGPETASRTEQLAKIIDAFDSPSLPPALPIVSSLPWFPGPVLPTPSPEFPSPLGPWPLPPALPGRMPPPTR